MSKDYRAAIIGVGAIANLHAQAIGDIPNVELVAGCCRTQDKGQAFADKFTCRYFSSYDEMLGATNPDFVTVATPSGAHLEPVVACAQRGVSVLCEKPLEITTARVDAMIAAANKGRIKLGGFFPQRFNPVVQQVHRAAREGRFGSLAAATISVPWWRDDAYYAPSRWQGTVALDGGGAMMNQSIHGVDALQWIANAANDELGQHANPVAQVAAFTGQRGHDPAAIEVEDTAVAILKFRGGAVGQILGATSMYPGSLRRLQVGGPGGTAEILEDQLITWQFRDPQDEDEQVRRKFGEETKTGGGASDPMAIDYSMHTRNIEAFTNWLESDDPFILCAREARKAVAVIEAIYQSAATGKIVDVA